MLLKSFKIVWKIDLEDISLRHVYACRKSPFIWKTFVKYLIFSSWNKYKACNQKNTTLSSVNETYDEE